MDCDSLRTDLTTSGGHDGPTVLRVGDGYQVAHFCFVPLPGCDILDDPVENGDLTTEILDRWAGRIYAVEVGE
jgi:hypothetical protein